MAQTEALDWTRDGADWPNREASRFVEAAGFAWHVQTVGDGPVLLLLHGTGASTHSWRDLLPILARDFTVVAPDLPGHAFTVQPPREKMSMAGMAMGLAALLRTLGREPALAVGHSAGAAVAIRMTLDGAIAPRGIVGLNAALLPIGGAAGQLLSPLAKLVSQTSIVPRLFAWTAGDGQAVDRLLKQTGSTIDAIGSRFYARLAGNPIHTASALTMMAEWDLWRFETALPGLKTPLALVVGGQDGTIAPADAFRVRDLLPATKVDYLRGLGHLAHEERPAQIASLILGHARAWGILP